MPDPVGQSATYLTSLACASVGACTAVGYANPDATHTAAIAYRWDGSVWQAQSVPAPSSGNVSQFASVSCGSPNDCVAVGVSGGVSWIVGQPFAAHWNGSSWSLTTPDPVPGAQAGGFNSISCPSATECLAVGAWIGSTKSSGAFAERWDGSAWVLQSIPTARLDQLKAISCSSLTACVAVGENRATPVILHWDGNTWVSLAPAAVPDAGLSCVGTSSCTAVGGTDGSTTTVVWDGSNWTAHAISYRLGARFSNLNAVSCSSTDACVAVGQYLTTAGQLLPLVERWNGNQWRREATPLAADSGLSAVSCVSSDDCTAVGSARGPGSNAGTAALHWDGRSWQIQPTPITPWPSNWLKHLACSRTGTDGRSQQTTVCTAVGIGYGGNGNTTGIAERWDGSTWQLQNLAIPAGGSVELTSISCPTVMECHSVGKVYIDPPCVFCTGDPTNPPRLGPCSFGCFADQHWDGSQWSYQLMQSTPNQNDRGFYEQVLGVSCPAAGTCFAVGYFAFAPSFAQRLTDGSWALQPTPDPSGYSAVSCPTVTSCTSVATQRDITVGLDVGLATHWDDTSWADQPMRTPAGSSVLGLESISCPTAHMCMTVGGQERSNFANSDPGPQVALAEIYADGQN